MPVSRKQQAQGKWYHHGKSLGWSKDDGQIKRRRAALASRRGNYLKTARALQSLANVTTDPTTKRRATADARYFYGKYAATRK